MTARRPTGLSLQPGSSEPIFEQIAGQIAARIRGGTFPPGHRLPTTRELAQELATNRNTVVRAYEELAGAGLIHAGVGRGTFVAQRPPARAVSPAPRPELPWPTLLSRAAAAEPLGRLDRLPRGPEPKDLVNLTRLQPSPDLLPHEDLQRCLAHVLRTEGAAALGYAPREGVPRLRAAIAADLARTGVPAAAADILVTSGSAQALDVITRALVNPGDRFLVEGETYAGAINVLSVAGAALVPVPSDDEGPDLEALDRSARGAKGLYLIPNARNPTGTTISAARRERLVAWSHATGVPLVEDDYGADLNLSGTPPPPALRALDREVIHVGSYSKRLSPALRVGFVVCPPGLRGAFVALQHAMALGASAILQHALAEFLERGYLEKHLARTLPVYRRRRDAVEGALRRHLPADVRWSHVERGIIVWLQLPPDLSPEAVFVAAQARGVLVSPGTLHTVSGRSQGLRLAFSAEPERRLIEGVRRLVTAIEDVRKRPAPARTGPAISGV
jgi:DNA-binding transcriptional MocR family regulator